MMYQDVAASLQGALDLARRAPFYRNRLPRGAARDWARWQTVPLLTKGDLRGAYPFGLLAVDRDRLATYHESSGTSGEPTSSFFTDEDWDDLAERFARNAVALGPGDCVLVKTPYSMVTTAHQMHRAARLKGALVIPADNRSKLMPYAKVVRLLRDLHVTVAWCLPTEVALWAAAARAAGLDPARDFPALRAFVVAGEPMSEARRARLSSVWGGRRIFEDYGSTETGSLGGECQEGRLHLWDDRLFFEVMDDLTGRAGLHGEGQLIVTTLYREGMPLVRYALEDRVLVEPAGCPCGSPHATVRVLGRASSAVAVGAHSFLPVDLESIVYSLPESYGVLFWRARLAGASLAVEIEPARGQEDLACDELAHEIFRRLGVRAEVRTPAGDPIVPARLLTESAPFQKPRFLFAAHEDWRQATDYW